MLDHALIDIHSHILPGWDGSPLTLEGAVSMASASAEQGVGAIVATPRLRDRDDAFDRAMAIRESAWWLQDVLDEAGIPITVFPGAQMALGRYLLEALRRGAPITLASTGKYVLVDLPAGRLEPSLGLVDGLTRIGVTPVLAHPERSPALQQEPQAVRRFVERGALVQINSSSLVCDDSPAECNAAMSFLTLRMVHFIASDAQAGTGREATLLQALEAAARIVGEEEAWRLVTENPNRVLRGEPLEVGHALRA